MNPLTNVKNVTKLNELELNRGTSEKTSWHSMYKDSAWIFIGGLPYDLTEGDIITVFSQFGEIANINLIREKKTGKSKGYCFMCYVNQKSTILAVDNLNGIKLCDRTIRVDHVANYKPPKEREDDDELTKKLHTEGCAPAPIKIEDDNVAIQEPHRKVKKGKKKKEKKKKKKKRKHSSSSSQSSSGSDFKNLKIKQERMDPGYEKYSYNRDNTGDKSGSSMPDPSSHEHKLSTDVFRQKTTSRLGKEAYGSDVSDSEKQSCKRRRCSPDAQNVRDRSELGNVQKETDVYDCDSHQKHHRRVNDRSVDTKRWKHNSQTHSKADLQNDSRKSNSYSSDMLPHDKELEWSKSLYTKTFKKHSSDNERDYSNKYQKKYGTDHKEDRKQTSRYESKYDRYCKELEHQQKKTEENRSSYQKHDSNHGKEKGCSKSKYNKHDGGTRGTQRPSVHSSQWGYSSSSNKHKER